MILKAIIIDDESAAIGYLKSLIDEYIPEVDVVATASNALEGIKCLNENTVDVIFLDIEMPGGTGFDFVETIDHTKYKIVFTTAYADFALKAFKINADGYLLKPIDIDDLEELVRKFVQNHTPTITIDQQKQRIAFRTQESIEYVVPDNIIRVESSGNYSTIYVEQNRKLMISKNMKQVEELLPFPFFVKPHKSHLINTHHIKRFIKINGGYFEMTDDSEVPVSRRKKDALLKMLEIDSA